MSTDGPGIVATGCVQPREEVLSTPGPPPRPGPLFPELQFPTPCKTQARRGWKKINQQARLRILSRPFFLPIFLILI